MNARIRGFLQACAAVAVLVVSIPPQAAMANDEDLARATFAGGCFWCMEPPYDQVDGVIETISGFSGGNVENPTYNQVVGGGTGHLEVVQIVYNPEKSRLRALLEIYWPNVDPFDGDGQFCDRGESYRPAIFVHDERQERLARESLERIRQRFEQPIEVTIEPFEAFYAAEDYHQNYYQENSVRYKYYRWRCGRDDRLESVWGEQAGG